MRKQELENLAKSIVEFHNLSDSENFKLSAKRLLRELHFDENQFRDTGNDYLFAEALYLIIIDTEDDFLTDRQYFAILKISYMCLLHEYIKNEDMDSSDDENNEFINANKLALIILIENPEIFYYKIMIGFCGYLPNYAQKHLRNQLYIFLAIIKKANKEFCNTFANRELDDLFTRYFDVIDKNFSIPLDKLDEVKNVNEEVIQSIYNHIAYNLVDNDFN